LTEETVETLWLLGAWDLVVGVSGFAVRPKEARQKPRVSSFLSARYEKILALEPDLVLAFSDLQAEIGRDLVKMGVPVFTFNQRSVDEILSMIQQLGGIVGYHEEAAALVTRLQLGIDATRERAASLPRRPRVYFEEWDRPMISGIRWVTEIVGIAGGEDILPELRECRLAKDRIPAEATVIARDPELILASWCGKKVRPERIAGRPGWEGVTAVRQGRIFEIKSPIILQPGPAALTDGLAELERRVGDAARG
jgi:iron complex transport system substrate-binding protein